MDNEKIFIENFRNSHNGGWKTFFKAYKIVPSFKKSKSILLAVIITGFIQIFLGFSQVDLYSFLVGTINRNLSIIPNLLGFAIGAYALFLSGFSDQVFRKIVFIKERFIGSDKPRFNTFQETSAIFGMSIFIMSIGLSVNYILSLIIDTKFFNVFNINGTFADIINHFIIFILNIISIYAILIIFNIMINLFAFSQFISAMKTLEKNDL
ncbi:hypothetical protein D3C87_272550 [compost metagenome]